MPELNFSMICGRKIIARVLFSQNFVLKLSFLDSTFCNHCKPTNIFTEIKDNIIKLYICFNKKIVISLRTYESY